MRRQFRIINRPPASDESLGARPYQTRMRAGANRHRCGMRTHQGLEQRNRRCCADPIFFALHLVSSGKALSLHKTNFNITEHAVEALLKNSTILSDDPLVISGEIVRRN